MMNTKMKTIINSYITVFFAAVSMTGCQKEDIPYYDDTHDAVRFPVSNLSTWEVRGYEASSALFYTGYSFIENLFAEYAIYDIPLVLIGKSADHDRIVNFTIDTERSTAPNDSYEILESVVPADSIAGRIRIKLYNVEALDNEVYELRITLSESEELLLAPAKYTGAVMTWHNNLPAPGTTSLIRTYNYMIDSPVPYNSTSFEHYSPNALKTIVDALGWDNWDDYDIHGSYYNSDGYKYLPRYTVINVNSRYKSYAVKLGVYIDAYNETHPNTPLVHNAGGQNGKPIKARIYGN